jgi:hypothetical protein
MTDRSVRRAFAGGERDFNVSLSVTIPFKNVL